MDISKNQVIHIVGIGGIGMSGIAEILSGLGYSIQGSDLFPNNNVLRLRKKKIKIFIGHKKSNIKGADIIIYSSAINKSNSELKYALSNDIPILSRSEILSQIVKLKKTILISGSHGKTTTTTMISSLLSDLDLAPTVINGGIINQYGTNTYLGTGKWMVVEADESDGTFIKLQSVISVVTNIDKEHLEFYGSFKELKKSFQKFISHIPFYGFAVVCLDDKNIESLIKKITNTNIITYGLNSNSNIKAKNLRYYSDKTVFDVYVSFKSKRKIIKNFSIPIIGKYNVLNALAAISIAIQMNLSVKKTMKSLKNFKGVQRRLTQVGSYNKLKLIDDYAHHPTEIRSVLEAVKKSNPKSIITAIFQPHRYSRLLSLEKDFSSCFKDADFVFVSDVYAASEKKPKLFNINQLVKQISKKSKTKSLYFSNYKNLKNNIIQNESEGIYIFLGAGSVTEWPYKLLKLLNEKR